MNTTPSSANRCRCGHPIAAHGIDGWCRHDTFPRITGIPPCGCSFPEPLDPEEL